MKIGTLTLHLPFNYGNALQMLALHRYLIAQGYDAEVLSHWYCSNRREIEHYTIEMRTFRGKIRFLCSALQFNFTFAQYRKERKLQAWMRDHYKWSKEEGTDKDFPAAAVTHDLVIVGSDQIWNPKHSTSDFFLLPAFPDRVRKIAYAASFGTDQFNPERIPFYRDCLKRFEAISMRESSGVEIVKNQLENSATLVCDPTLLHTKEEWCHLLGIQMPTRIKDEICLYLVTPSFREEWREIVRIAKHSGKRVHFFAFPYSPVPMVSVRNPLKALKYAVANVLKRCYMYWCGVRFHFDATPSEFVEQLAACNGLITDSFHGMMFATIFEKPCAITIGTDPERLQMSARLRNFTVDFGRPEILTPQADETAMRKLVITPQLQNLIRFSKKWLKEVIDG